MRRLLFGLFTQTTGSIQVKNVCHPLHLVHSGSVRAACLQQAYVKYTVYYIEHCAHASLTCTWSNIASLCKLLYTLRETPDTAHVYP